MQFTDGNSLSIRSHKNEIHCACVVACSEWWIVVKCHLSWIKYRVNGILLISPLLRLSFRFLNFKNITFCWEYFAGFFLSKCANFSEGESLIQDKNTILCVGDSILHIYWGTCCSKKKMCWRQFLRLENPPNSSTCILVEVVHMGLSYLLIASSFCLLFRMSSSAVLRS